MKPAPQFAPTKADFIDFSGGYDTETPPLKLKPGALRMAQNLECKVNGGYVRFRGYERLDGRPKPSAAAYAVIAITLTGAIAVGNTVTGVTSAATGVVIAVPAGQVVVTKVTGTFVSGEVLNVAASPQATTTSAAITDGASTALLHAQYKNLAADVYRADITAVPGSGSILGVVTLNDVRYAFRNNVGGTAAAIYKSSTSGWTAVALGRELAFTSGGTTEITEGQTITGATSGATAVLTRVMLESGSWAAGTAAGKFIFASQTGTFQAENIDVGASPNLATIAGNSSAITLLPSGRYEFEIENITGTKRIYGVDRVNRGFEFDGTVFCPITTGMTTDTPNHVRVHKNHLFFFFAGSAQHSGIGTPYKWTLLSGASELAMGDTITGSMPLSGSEDKGALGIFTRNRTKILYGSSSSDWNLVTLEEEQGAIAHTIQKIGQTIMLDDRGVTSLTAAQSYGNFQSSTFTAHIQRWLNAKRLIASASCIARDKGLYRLFFTDGSALSICFNGRKLVGMTPLLLVDEVRCIWSKELNDGSEEIIFGSDDGFVYQMDKGTSFDGDAIEWYGFPAFNHAKSPRLIKHWKHAMFEVRGDGYAEFNVAPELSYNSSEIGQAGSKTVVTALSPVFWDSFVWDAFVWDGVTLLPSSCKLEGRGENVSVVFRGSSDYHEPLEFSGVLLDYSEGRRLRK